jgi:UDP-glucose 4-epimerase
MTEELDLVTGGAGFIGSRLVRSLADAGRRVVVLDNLSFGRQDLVDPRAELVRLDLRDGAAVLALLRTRRPRRVFHLGALHFIPYCNANPVEAVEVNVNGTRNLLDACRAAAPEALFFASTAAVYPLEGGPFSEAVRPAPVDIYGHTKLVGEELSRLFALETGVATRVGRFFNAFGPDDTNPHLIPAIAEQLAAGAAAVELGNLEPVRDYIHVSDVAAAVLRSIAVEGEPFMIWNVGTGRGLSVREVVGGFAAALGRPLEIRQEASRIRPVERPELVADVARLEGLGWRPRTRFEEGLRELVRRGE